MLGKSISKRASIASIDLAYERAIIVEETSYIVGIACKTLELLLGLVIRGSISRLE